MQRASPRLVDPFVLAIAGAATLGWFAPARGALADALPTVTKVAIAVLFFLHGARLSREALLAGAAHPRLHALVFASTFLAFPALALALVALAGRALGPELSRGVLLVGALPATVQSAIAFTSLARGNVAAAVCSAALSSVLGVVLTPLLLGALLAVAPLEASASVVDASASSAAPPGLLDRVGALALQLLAPFAAGHLSRPLVAAFVARQRRALRLVDQGSIVLVVYVAFGDAAREGVLSSLGPGSLAVVGAVSIVLLVAMLAFTWAASGAAGLAFADRVTVVFAGSKKSLASGVPMATVLLPGAAGLALVPLMLFHQVQLMACGALAGRWARRADDDANANANAEPP